MFKLDNEFLTKMGLGSLPVDEKNKLLQAIYERLEMNVGMRLAEKMTDDQLNEFEGFIDRSDEAGALRWLETNFPNYKQVVAEELDKLQAEVAASAPQILAAAQASFAPSTPATPHMSQQPAADPYNPAAPPAPEQSQQQVQSQPPQNPTPPPTAPWDTPTSQPPAGPQYPQQ